MSTHPNSNVTIGNVGLLREDNLQSSSWPLAVVTQVYPDSGGVIRTIEVKLGNVVYKQLITKLVALIECKP